MHFAIYKKLILVGRTVGDGTTPQRPFLLHQQWDHFPMLLYNFIDQLLLSDLYDNENPLHGKLKWRVFTLQRVSIG